MKDIGGADVGKVKLFHYQDDYREVHAAQDIKAGEIIMFIPYKQFITYDNIKSPLNSDSKDSKLLALCVYIM